MINIKFNQDGKHFNSFKSTGHAGFNPGNDIVCAGVSALSYALLGTLHNVKNVSFKKEKVREGNMNIITDTKDPIAKEVADIAFKTVYIGLLQLAETYPANIKVTLLSKEGS